jgi:hypothetical protein
MTVSDVSDPAMLTLELPSGAQIDAVNSGDMRRPEAMLTAQAHVLNELFNTLARRAATNLGEYLSAAETYMRLALKAQSQCRATLETLSAIKHPPVAGYIQQAHIAHGPQQVNNAPAEAREAPRTRETEIEPNKQSGADSELLQDARASQAESGIDPQMEALGEVRQGRELQRGGLE